MTGRTARGPEAEVKVQIDSIRTIRIRRTDTDINFYCWVFVVTWKVKLDALHSFKEVGLGRVSRVSSKVEQKEVQYPSWLHQLSVPRCSRSFLSWQFSLFVSPTPVRNRKPRKFTSFQKYNFSMICQLYVCLRHVRNTWNLYCHSIVNRDTTRVIPRGARLTQQTKNYLMT